MIIDIDHETLSQIKNPGFSEDVSRYLLIYADFMEQIRQIGLDIDGEDDRQKTKEKIQKLRQKGVACRNADKSLYINRISPSCVACQTGEGSATYFISLKCHRDCFYCFNPNQEDYDYFSHNQRDCVQELQRVRTNHQKLAHLALTGGEPLLHKGETVNFYRYAREAFPRAYTRLYTCGDYIDSEILKRLQETRLNEIRFSIRMHDLEKGRRFTLEKIAQARDYIPNVMVEMPVLPGTLDVMQEVLQELNYLGIFGINLLEFCFPYRNVDAFKERSFRVKNHPFRVLYDYWYAGGLPIAGSEEECLDLLEYALDERLSLGVHYCSLENKHTGQIFKQNASHKTPALLYFSEKDFFFKSAKVYGEDIPKALKVFKAVHYDEYSLDPGNILEFHVRRIKTLRELDVEVGISTKVIENREGENYIRELKVDYTTPQLFNLVEDV